MSQNLFEPVPEESLFGDPRDKFERLRSAVMAFRRERVFQPRPSPWLSTEPAPPAEVCDAVADLLLLFLDRKIGDGKNGPACNSQAVVEVVVGRVIKAITGRHLRPEEVFKD